MSDEITFTADIIQHAVDNGVRHSDYDITEVLETPSVFNHVRVDPCDILPRQFGYWFHTGPGFAPMKTQTYCHRILASCDVRVLGNDGVPVLGGNWVDSTSLGYARTGRTGSQFAISDGRLSCKPVTRRLAGHYFLGFNAGHNNYAHWLTDQVPMLHYYQQRLESEGVRLLMPRDHAPFVAYFLDALRIDTRLIEYIGDEVVEVENLTWPGFFSFDAIPYSAMAHLKAIKDDILPQSESLRTGLYVSRNETATRTLLNERALTRILADNGFRIIVPGQMSVDAQIAAFRDADVVVGCHGAGMANIVFCDAGTRVIELFPEYTVSSHFWMLAGHFELQYGAIFGTSFDQDQGLSELTGSWDAPFVINERDFRRCLKL